MYMFHDVSLDCFCVFMSLAYSVCEHAAVMKRTYTKVNHDFVYSFKRFAMDASTEVDAIRIVMVQVANILP